jgi:ubiquinone/menaquinone biosynthesis C-methylase UbiE
MNANDAARLIGAAVPRGTRWVDLGAGSGTFTLALARLIGPSGTVYAIERDASAIRSLESLAERQSGGESASIFVRRADFTEPLGFTDLDGALLANALHFVPVERQSDMLRNAAHCLTSAGSIVIVEYDNRPQSRWVPYPVSLRRLGDLTRHVGLGAPEAIGRRESDYGGAMYVARIAVSSTPRILPVP